MCYVLHLFDRKLLIALSDFMLLHCMEHERVYSVTSIFD